jgi:hypothetical protein
VWNVVSHFKGRLRVFKKRMEETREWDKFDNEELHDLYSSPDIISTVKSRRMGWVGRVACMGGGEIIQGFSGEA